MALRNIVPLSELTFNVFGKLNRNYKTNVYKSCVRNFKRTRNSNPTTQSLTPFEGIYADTGPLSIGKLWKPLGFTVVFSSASFVGAAIWQYENMRAHAIAMIRKPVGWLRNQFEVRKHSNQDLQKWWRSLSEGEKLFVPICLLNVLVFGMWRIPSLQPTMVKYFCSNPASRAICWPMLLSTFSHYSGFHLLANMYVLYSFSKGSAAVLGKEQLLALYLSAGAISSFSSYFYKVLTKQPGLSLGASGAIMAILGFVCTQFPDTQLGIVFLPFFTFSAGAAIKVIVGLDLAGVILGWRFFDHAAHLGGAFWGMFYAYLGQELIWQQRGSIVAHWHNLRGAPQK